MPITEKQFARLKKLKTKKGRQKERKFLVEGVRCLQELLASNYQVEQFFICEDRLTETGWKFLDQRKNLHPEILNPRRFDQLISEKTSQGIIAVANHKNLEYFKPGRANFVLIVERMSDPSNLGSVIRSAVSFGVPLVVGPLSAELYSPKVISASSGFLFRADITVSPSVLVQLNHLRENGFLIYGADSRGVNIQKLGFAGKRTALVIGNEAFGLSEDVRQKIDKTVKIPIRTEIDSLSAPVATGILLFALTDKMRKIK